MSKRTIKWRLLDENGKEVYERWAEWEHIGCNTFTLEFEEDIEVKQGDKLEIEIYG